MHKLACALAFAATLTLPSMALAGGCPTCTSDTDCMPPGGGVGFCVEWSRDFGCGSQRIACCPGQACAIESGRPSCEGVDRDGDEVDDCRIYSADAGVPMTDAGPGIDGGPIGTDAGTVDAGPARVRDEGCGCRVGATQGAAPAALIALLGAALVLRSRRSRS